MNEHITNALNELKAAGAMVLPKASTIATSWNGKVWSGKKQDGSIWTLTKNNQESYTCTC